MKIQQIITQILLTAILSIIFISAVYSQEISNQQNDGIGKLERISETKKNPSKEMIVIQTKEMEQKMNLSVASIRTKLNDQNKRERFNRDFAPALYTETNSLLPALKIKEVLHSEQSIYLEPGIDLEAAEKVLAWLKNVENQLN